MNSDFDRANSPDREQDLYDEALRIGDELERERHLDERCDGDVHLRNRLSDLLAARREAEAFFDSDPLKHAGLEMAGPESGMQGELEESMVNPGVRIGNYLILERIGEGGFGEVFLARQNKPVRRMVAIKIIKPGMDTKEVIARFEAERQALALMDYPHIAKVLDAGTTERGRPFFVMELVRGMPVTDFCCKHCLTVEERLELFVLVCEAIQHAHQKGVIHRDIKPSNVLVEESSVGEAKSDSRAFSNDASRSSVGGSIAERDRTGKVRYGRYSPKIIDFGVAKAMDMRLTEKTIHTGLTRMIGTPAYMSPEQAAMGGKDVDTRTDVYALGVLLYELLTGTPPFPQERFRDKGFAEIQRMILEEEPVWPSVNLGRLGATVEEIAKNRGCGRMTLLRQVRGDLDWMVMKALDKERERRYHTAQGFANDVRRHLDNEPVEAAAPTFFYRSQKFVRRHRLGIGVALVMAVVLAGGTMVSLWQAVRAGEASVKERKAREIAQRSLYAAELNLACLSVQAGNPDRGINLLKRQIPEPGEPDLRGFEWAYLWGQIHRGRIEMVGHERDIHDVKISPDGRYVATGSDDGSRLWDFHTGHEMALITGPGKFSTRVDFSPNGRLLAATGQGEVVILWDVISQKEVERLDSKDGPIDRVRFAPDGKSLFVACPNGNLHLWDLSTRHVEIIKAHRWWAGEIKFSRDGSKVVTCSGDSTIKIWDRKSMNCLATLTEHHGAINDLALAPDRDLAVSCGRLGKVLVWDILKGHLVKFLDLPVNEHGPVGAVTFSKDGSILVLGYSSGRISFLSTKDWTEIGDLYGSPILSIDLSPVENRLVMAGSSGRLVAQDILLEPDKGLFSGTNQYPRCLKISPDGTTLAAGMAKGAIHVWDLAEEREILRIPGYTNHDPFKQNPFDMHYFDYAPDSRFLVTATDGPHMDVWDLEQKRLQHSFTHTNRVYGIDWSPGGKFIAAGENNGVVTLWDVDSALPIRQIQAHQSRVHFLVFSPDERHLATTSWDTTQSAKIKIWEILTGKLVASLGGHFNSDGVGVMIFSPDGTMLATGGPDRRVLLWNTTNWTLKTPLFGHAGPITDLSFSRDMTRLATGAQDGVIRFWDLTYYHEVFTLEGSLVEFGPETDLLVTAKTAWLPLDTHSEFSQVIVHRPPSLEAINPLTRR